MSFTDNITDYEALNNCFFPVQDFSTVAIQAFTEKNK